MTTFLLLLNATACLGKLFGRNYFQGYSINIMIIRCIFVFLCVLLVACNERAAVDKKGIEEKERQLVCLTSQNACEVNNALGKFSVLFDAEPVLTEQPFHIVIRQENSETPLTINAYLEGKEMFMGKVPVFFSPFQINEVSKVDDVQTTEQFYRAETLLASCSEEIMTWRLVVTVSDSANEQPRKSTFVVEFDSTRS